MKGIFDTKFNSLYILLIIIRIINSYLEEIYPGYEIIFANKTKFITKAEKMFANKTTEKKE